jgi:arginine:ornithine antiporter/lysine permease
MQGTAAVPTAKLGVWTLTAIVVGSMVGAGVFSLPARFAESTGVFGSLIAWSVAGLGMLTLALAFQALALRKPALDAGIYAYAKAGFGEYAGFFSAFGYWASACVGNVTYWVLIMSTLGAWFPALGEGDTVLAIALSSAGLWVFFLLVRRGLREATAVNRVVTAAKLVPIVVFVLIALFALRPEVFVDNLFGDVEVPLFEQVRATMLVTVFVFLGVEGASVYSRHARRRRDVGRATLLGFLSVFAIFASVTIVSYGILPASEIAALRQPSMAGVLESVVGEWGAVLVSAGLIVSVLGAYLAWTLMAAEVMFVAAKDGDMPRFLARQNAKDVPTAALLASTVLAQVFLVLTVFSEDAFTFALNLTSALVLIPFLLVAGYLLKIAVRGDGYARAGGDGGDGRSAAPGRRRELVIGLLATVYVAFLLFAAGWTYVLVSFLIYAPATVFFAMARREQGRRVFSRRELAVFAISIAGALVAVLGLALGWISI